MENTANKSENVKFYTVAEFKTRIGASETEKAQVVKNPKTDKLFLKIGSQNFKCQHDIDSSKEIRVLVEDDEFDKACLVNTKASTENVLFTL